MRYSASSMCSGSRVSARSTSISICGIDPRLANPPASPRSSSTGGRSPPIAARFLQRQIDQFAGFLELLDRARIVDRLGRGVQPVRQRDEPLRDAVVDVTGQPASFDLLRLDHLLDEVLVRAFAGHQLAVQPGLVRPAISRPITSSSSTSAR